MQNHYYYHHQYPTTSHRPLHASFANHHNTTSISSFHHLHDAAGLDLNKKPIIDNEIENSSSAKRQNLHLDLNTEWIIVSSDDDESISASKVELPQSSTDLDLDDDVSPFDFISVYSFLRSFSCFLFLSPFRITDFVQSVKNEDSTLLFDSVHVSLLTILRKHLQIQASSTASECLRCLNWDLLDLITWPMFLFEYLLVHSPGYIPGLNLREAKPFQNSYYKLPFSTKVEILKHLCDEVVEVGAFRIEMDVRTAEERDVELNLNYDSNDVLCSLCGMGGNLLCCDSCPAAFHSKCIGVVLSLLPKSEWYCPECVFEKENPWINVGKAIRGAELLGIDQSGRQYHSSCGYVLVSESHEHKCLYWSYNRDDIPNLIKTLESSPFIDGALIKRIEFLKENISDRNAMDIESDIAQCAKIHSESNYGNNYFNYYAFGREISFVREELACISDNATQETVAAQTKAISNKYPVFSWSNIQHSNVNSRKENCGWCCYCGTKTDKVCLLITNTSIPVLENFTSKELGIELNKRENHLIDVVCHMISIEDNLHGLLLGPWLKPSHSMIWRRYVAGVNTISSLKPLLLMLESNLHRRAFSTNWRKHVDSAPTMVSVSHIVRNTPKAFSKHGFHGRRGKCAHEMLFFWWRGGSGSRKLFNFKGLPRSLALKAARQGGCKKIPGVLYPERGQKTKMTRYDAWRAAVESSRTVDQFALQIRELNANIEWCEIGNTIHSSQAHRDPNNLFRKAIIHKKCSEGSMIKYLIDFGKQRNIPCIVLKHGVVPDDTSNKKKYWLEESHVPLYLLKSFEEKRIVLKSDKTGFLEHDEISGLIRKPIRKTGFDYLFTRAEQPVSYLCAHCEQDVIAREAVSCQYCKGYFHKRHVKKFDESPSSECILYTCHKCRKGKLVNAAAKEKEEFAELKTVPEGLKRKRSSRGIKKRAEQLQNFMNDQRVSPVVPLLHSAMFAERSTRDESSQGILERLNTRGWTKKKRSAAYPSYWLEGLKMSRRTDDERVIQFRRKELLVLSSASTSNINKPNCSLCDEMEYEPDLVYLACEACGGNDISTFEIVYRNLRFV